MQAVRTPWNSVPSDRLSRIDTAWPGLAAGKRVTSH